MQKWGDTNVRVATGDHGTVIFFSFLSEIDARMKKEKNTRSFGNDT